ncbi:MAG: ribonuclease J [Rickettsiales bacterium]|nr:ribonuclease J [Rickettsiales bacterium]
MALKFESLRDQLLFVPLGGSNEIGMNLNLYHLDGKWLMVDLGIGFADDFMPGIEIVLPDIDFIVERRKDLLGLVLTHAHEDHIGAVPYLWDELQCPVYATPFTASVLRYKLQGEGLSPNSIPVTEVNAGDTLELGPFSLDFVPLTHSIPEMQALAIRTRHGTVMHTGDWKLDDAPMVGPVSDELSLNRYGDEGVLAMVCDSTNVFVEGVSGSESDVRDALVKTISECKGRAIVTTFASNIARVQSIMHAAHLAGRHVVLAGRSLYRMDQAARAAGYHKDIPEPISDKEAAGLPHHQVLILCTGGQGEPRAALSKLVQGNHPILRIASGDTVIFSTRVIPGNETRVRWLKNMLIRNGIEIITDADADIHVSGHPAREELRRMYQMIRPQIAVPVHGEAAHLKEHSRFAESMQVPEVVIGYNGAVIQLSKGDARILDTVHSGYIAMDGTSMIPVNSPVIRMRRKLRDDGNITVSVVIDGAKQLLSAPQITAPGSLDTQEDEALRHALEEDIVRVFEGNHNKKATLHSLSEKLRNVLRKRIQEELGKKPVLEVHLHQIM